MDIHRAISATAKIPSKRKVRFACWLAALPKTRRNLVLDMWRARAGAGRKAFPPPLQECAKVLKVTVEQIRKDIARVNAALKNPLLG